MSDERSPDIAPSSSKLARLAEQLDSLDSSTDGDAPIKSADLARLIRLSEQYEGPFPHPEVLRRLNGVVENGAERAFAMSEREQSHRHDIDQRMLSAEVRDLDRLGVDRRIIIIGGMVLVLAGLVMSFVAAIRGNYVVSGVAGVAAVVAAVTGALRVLKQSSSRDKPAA